MSRLTILLVVIQAVLCVPASAQDPPPPIGPFVVDMHLIAPNFPDNLALARSRGVNQTDLPGVGFGVHLAGQVYVLRWRAVTFGVGGEVTRAEARSTPPRVEGQPVSGRAVTERFTSFAPQLSFNFGNGTGWSYISGGLGRSTWWIVPDATTPRPVDEEKLKTINYGGGARWFAKDHLAFSFDVRFYAINPGALESGFPQSPRTTLMVIGAGVSIK